MAEEKPLVALGAVVLPGRSSLLPAPDLTCAVLLA